MKAKAKPRPAPAPDHESALSPGIAFDAWNSMRILGDEPPAEIVLAAAIEILGRWEREEDRHIPLDPHKPEDAAQILRTAGLIDDAEQAVRDLGPAAAAVYACLEAAMKPWTASVSARLASTNAHLLIIVRSPSHHWHKDVKAALRAWIMHRQAERGSHAGYVELAYPKADYHTKAREFRMDSILALSSKSHVVAAFQGDEVVPELLHSLADAQIDIASALGPVELASVVATRFDGRRPHWPGSLFAHRFTPDLLEAALTRAREPDDVHRVVESVVIDAEVAKAVSAGNQVAESAKAVAKASSVVTRPTTPTLAELHGYGQARTWGETLAADLADYRSSKIDWSDVDAGCLLHGPPGTGKTLFASALAATCGVAFISTSFAQWQGRKGAHLGDVVQQIQATFALANENTPCIVFVDEIDAIPARGASQHHDDYWRPIITAMLESLDGTSRREGVVVVAACNHPAGLDAALVRSGRLDRRFEIGLPDEEALARIFAHHLPGLPTDVLDPVATALAGVCSGADAARIARDARRTARRAQREIMASDILDIALPADNRSEDVRRSVAVHEAGHAVIAMLTGHDLQTLSIVSTQGTQGGVTLGDMPKFVFQHDIARHVMFLLGGRAAEDVVLGRTSLGSGGGGGSDLQRATGVIRQYLFGGEGYGLTYGVETDAAGIDRHLQRLYAETVVLVGRHRRVIEALADLALERRVLGRNALVAFANEHLPEGGDP